MNVDDSIPISNLPAGDAGEVKSKLSTNDIVLNNGLPFVIKAIKLVLKNFKSLMSGKITWGEIKNQVAVEVGRDFASSSNVPKQLKNLLKDAYYDGDHYHQTDLGYSFGVLQHDCAFNDKTNEKGALIISSEQGAPLYIGITGEEGGKIEDNLETLKSIPRLELIKMDLSDVEVDRLCEVIKKNEQLSQFKLTSVTLTPEQGRKIGKALADNENVKYVVLHFREALVHRGNDAERFNTAGKRELLAELAESGIGHIEQMNITYNIEPSDLAGCFLASDRAAEKDLKIFNGNHDEFNRIHSGEYKRGARLVVMHELVERGGKISKNCKTSLDVLRELKTSFNQPPIDDRSMGQASPAEIKEKLEVPSPEEYNGLPLSAEDREKMERLQIKLKNDQEALGTYEDMNPSNHQEEQVKKDGIVMYAPVVHSDIGSMHEILEKH